METNFDGPTVIGAHDLPAQPSIASQYKNDPLNPAIASRLEDAIELFQPELRILGHTHVPGDYNLAGPRGEGRIASFSLAVDDMTANLLGELDRFEVRLKEEPQIADVRWKDGRGGGGGGAGVMTLGLLSLVLFARRRKYSS